MHSPRIDWRFFQSRIGRRIFLLFVISALFPLAILTALSVYHLDQQLSANSSRELRRETKNTGMQLLERLFHLESQLELAGRHLDEGAPRDHTDAASLRELVPGFSRLTLYPKGGSPVALLGPVIELPATDRPERPGTARILLAPTADPPAGREVLLARRPTGADGVLVGVIRPGVLWDFELGAETQLWLLDPAGRVLHSNVSAPPPGEIVRELLASASGTFPWTRDGLERHAGYWSIFLDYRFAAGSWTVLLSEPTARVFAQATQFHRIFLPTLLLALLLIVLLSLLQIRRFLTPVESLKRATGEIARRNFDSRVSVASGDEFEDLGDAFNRMARQLERQFHALSIMSTLDRAILATMDGEQIVRILFLSLKEVVDYDFLAIGLVDAADRQRLLLLVDVPGKTGIGEQHVRLAVADHEAFAHDSDQGIGMEHAQLPAYLAPYAGNDIPHFLFFPIRHKDQPAAIVCLGFRTLAGLQDCDGAELRDLFNRATLAYANAEWEEQLYRQAHYDPLTGLPNRLVLRDQLDLALERGKRHGYHGALVFIDLDNFKVVNDSLGHEVGDRLLIQVAETLKAHVRQTDTLARLGGDEFTVLVPDIGEPESANGVAATIASHLLSALSEPFRIDSHRISISASIGIALYPDDGDGSEDLLKYADTALYQAKAAGKAHFQFFSRAYQEAMLARNALLEDIKRALDAGEFRLFFQPKVGLQGRNLVGAEALIRWAHPDRGLLSPGAFLPEAEASELILPLGEWVIRAACAQVRHWLGHGIEPPRIAVNISARQFSRSDLVGLTRRILAETGVDAGYLEYEITESMALEDVDAAIQTLRALRQLGLHLAIDDFGTGYSALSYLKQLPVHSLKIDRSFISGLPGDRESLSITKAIIALAHGLEMDVVAEGVESEAQLELLQELGCDSIQGYLISPPVADATFAARHLAFPRSSPGDGVDDAQESRLTA